MGSELEGASSGIEGDTIYSGISPEFGCISLLLTLAGISYALATYVQPKIEPYIEKFQELVK